MPEMDGVTLLKKIFPKYRIPCVMISSISREEGTAVLDALENGAVDYIQKPQGSGLGESGALICERLKAAAKANVRSTARARKQSVSHKLDVGSLIVLGASTGGTEALKHVLEGLPKRDTANPDRSAHSTGFFGSVREETQRLLTF